ncbi:MAG: CrcB family protein, partial [Pseudomonadota bacterium]|nr:CrcB family protein [Pseudomonadota bacterium]
TFSTFSLETLLLIEQGHYNIALFNVMASVMFCLGAAYLGISLAKVFL